MRYEGRIFRPPSEAYSLIVQATIGCSHNRCTFCNMYKEKSYRVRPVADVLEDFNMARKAYPHVEKVFLADGDALMMKSSDLLIILNHIKNLFPECTRVTSYGSPKSILVKSPEELKSLKDAGLYMIYMGLETGNEELLKSINKGETVKEVIRAGIMVKDAGMILSVTAIQGLGGTKHWKEHAIDTGKAFSIMKPHYIGLLTLMFEGDTELYREYQAGNFELLSATQIAQENLLMLENMDCEGSVFRSNHASNYVSLAGTLNRDKESMINKLKMALDGDISFKKEMFRGL